ncbi:MAG: hypothetical protein K0R31_1349 [Clostridiales bacterium]|nr:hypothetical protein [Clostridiales bacterium]
MVEGKTTRKEIVMIKNTEALQIKGFIFYDYSRGQLSFTHNSNLYKKVLNCLKEFPKAKIDVTLGIRYASLGLAVVASII